MTILTLNLHCFAESDIQRNQQILTETIIKENIDIICFQEACRKEKQDYVSAIQSMLHLQNNHYEMYYKASNIAFNEFDEGVAILSKIPVEHVETTWLSKTTEYNNWLSRVAITVTLKGFEQHITVTSVHFGWTDDIEKFEDQFNIFYESLDKNVTNIVCGDFNIPDNSKEYRYITTKLVDLWNQHISIPESTFGDQRIDYIMATKELSVASQKVLFKSKDIAISDHQGVMMTLDLHD